MLTLRNFFTLSLVLSLSAKVFTQNSDHGSHKKEADSDLETFQRLLDQVDPPSLHAALHDYSPKKFKHGMFPEDRTAVEVIHREDAPLATSIIAIAKRQSPDISNGTATTPSTTTSEPGQTTRVTPVPEGASTSSTAVSSSSGTDTANTGSSASSSPSSSASAGAQPTDSGSSLGPSSAGQTASSTSGTAQSAGPTLTSGEVITTTNAAGVTVVSTLSAGSVVTTVNAAGVTIVTTVGGGSRTMSSSGSHSGSSTSNGPQSSHTSLVLQTTTLPNGSKSTVTAVTLVTADGAGSTPSGTAGVAASGTTSSKPGLQTALAARTGNLVKEMLYVVGGAVGVAMLM